MRGSDIRKLWIEGHEEHQLAVAQAREAANAKPEYPDASEFTDDPDRFWETIELCDQEYEDRKTAADASLKRSAERLGAAFDKQCDGRLRKEAAARESRKPEPGIGGKLGGF